MIKHIDDYTRKKVLELLYTQRDFLSELSNTKDLLKSEKEDNQKRNLDKEDIGQWIKTLNDEIQKVDRLEMTLAVVGTMKAGKSTTINAIVGTEVLPSRNQPMTTLPTLIRHEPGIRTPRLIFRKTAPFQQSLHSIKNKINELSQHGKLEDYKLLSTEGSRELVYDILHDGLTFRETEIIGSEPIYHFLKKLNDISRICDTLAIESPLIAYQSIDEFPVIEIEFLHLKNADLSGQGRFTLIDTPGPNEAGAKYLKDILADQLTKASAVLAVLDYTQLNAEADAEVRESLFEVLESNHNNLYVLVNKFDQRDRNGMDTDELKDFIANQLFEQQLESSRIFPVSSKYAYLSARALFELVRNGRLPNYQENSWVQDFGDEALGKRWQRVIDDVREVEESANDLWNESQFEAPLDQVIFKSSREASYISVMSALDKMLHYDKQMIDSLGLRYNAIKADIELLKDYIRTLEKDIEQVNNAKNLSKEKTTKSIEMLKVQFRELFEETKPLLDEKLKELFWKEEQEGALLQNIGYNATSPIFTEFIKSFNADRTKDIFIDPNGFSEFDNEEDAKYFVTELYEAIGGVLKPFAYSIQETSTKEINKVEKQLWENINDQIGPILQEAAQRINEVFNVEIAFAQPKVHSIHLDFSKFQNASIKNNKEIKLGTKSKRKWYTLWLTEKKETFTYTEDIFRVDLKSIGYKVLSEIGEKHKELEITLQQYVENEIWAQMEEYFKDLNVYLEKFRGDLIDAVQDKHLEEASLDKMVKIMSQVEERSKEHYSKVIELKTSF